METIRRINQVIDTLNKIRTQINQKLRCYDFEGADKLFQSINQIRDFCYGNRRNYGSRRLNLEDTNRISRSIDRLASDYNQLRDKYVRKYIEPKLEKIEQQLCRYNFENADELFEDISHFYHTSDYNQLRSHYVDEYATSTFNQIEQSLHLYNFESAEQLFQSISKLPQPEYQRLKAKYQCLKIKYTKRQILETIETALDNEEYIIADEHFFKSPLISAEEYETLKSRYVKRSLSHQRFELNDEQSMAIAKMDKHLLLAARAVKWPPCRGQNTGKISKIIESY